MEINFTLIGQMITFALFVWFTMKLVWPPIMRALAARQKRIAEGLAASDRAEQELEIARHKAKALIQDAKAQASAIVDQANHRAHRIAEEAQQQALDIVTKMKLSAEEDIEQQYRKVEAQLRDHTADLAVRCAEKILRQNVDKAANQALIEQVLAEVKA